MHKIFSIGHFRRDVFPVEIETDISSGIFRFDIIGLGDKAVEESKSRILSALKNSGYKVRRSTEKITILLSPANKRKEGSHFDLPIALSYLAKIGLACPVTDWIAAGELSLSGELRSIPNAAEYAFHAASLGHKNILMPAGNRPEFESLAKSRDACAALSNANIRFASNLLDAVHIIENDAPDQADAMITVEGEGKCDRQPKRELGDDQGSFDIDLIKGQEHAKRALVIALSGFHHLMIWGAPGTGKSMIAKAAVGLMPKSGAPGYVFHGAKKNFSYIKRATEGNCLAEPHHTSSYAELIGMSRKPGVLLNAHGGLLIMDEWSEFDRRALESMRQPLEDGMLFGEPCSFICIAATNPCACGYAGADSKKCSCKKDSTSKYERKIFGPAAQRFDLIVKTDEVIRSHKYAQAFDTERLIGRRIAEDIVRAREVQHA